MPNTELNERVARLEANEENNDEKIDVLTQAISELSKEVRTLSDAMQQAKGGWKVIMTVATIGGLFAEVLRWCVGHLSFKVGG